MNYEDLYQSLLPDEKSVKDSVAVLQKLSKNIAKETESGDLKYLSRDLDSLAQTAAALSDTIERLRTNVDAFDSRAYFESGDFAAQMLDICREMELDVQGEFPVYEMFPYRIRLDVENQDIYMDKKRIQCMRPSSFMNTVKTGQDKLQKAHFNAQSFSGELAEAYDLAILKQNRQRGSDMYLTTLYKLMAPMSRFRKDYNLQSFSFDIARLYAEFINGMNETKSGRRFDFGPTRYNRKAIRILDANGKEQFLATIRFMND
ncbi:MAG: hypothetical protein LIO80_06295 [Lachnospiraceae bacterium]|nr:hypothetical protein [Lachnospiraceae bacterium]